MMHSFLISALLAASSLTSIVSAVPLSARGVAAPTCTPNAPSRDEVKLAVYYGQGPSQDRLSTFCSQSSYDIIPVGFVNGFGNGYTYDSISNTFKYNYGWPSANFGNQCGSANYTLPNGTVTNMFLSCGQLATDIAACQNFGKKITLSIGGDNSLSPYQLGSDDEGRDFAEKVWGMFGPVQAGWGNQPRPFGNVVVDGIDLDLEMGTNTGYSAMAQRFRELMGNSYLLTAAPQCAMPDSHLSQALSVTRFDHIYVQFYNTDSCSAAAGVQHIKTGSSGDINFKAWADFASNLNQSPTPKVFLGLPGSADAALSGYYVKAADAKLLIDKYHTNPQFGGVMIWEATYAQRNKDGDFTQAMKQALDNSFASQSACTSTTTTTTTTSATSTSSSTTSTTTSSSTTTTTSSTTATSSSSSVSTSTSSSSTSSSSSSTSSSSSSTSSSSSSTSSSSSSTSSSSSSTVTTMTSSTSSMPTTTLSTSTSTTSMGHGPGFNTTTSETSSSTSTTTSSSTSSSTSTSTSSSGTTTETSTTTRTDGATITSSSSTTKTSSSSTTSESNPWEDWTMTTSSRSSDPTTAKSDGWNTWSSTTTKKSADPTTKSNEWGTWSTTTSKSIDPTGIWSEWSKTTSKPADPTTSTWISWSGESSVYVTTTTTVYVDVCPTGYTTKTATITATFTATDGWSGQGTPSGAKPTGNWPVGTGGVPSGFYTTETVCSAGCAATPITVTVTIPIPTGPITKTVTPDAATGTGKPSSPVAGVVSSSSGAAAWSFWTTAASTAGSPVAAAVTGAPSASASTSASASWNTWAASASGTPASASGSGSGSGAGIQGVKAYTGGAAAEQAPATAFSIAVCLALAIAGLVL